MKTITKEMLTIYKPHSHLDWMNYHLVKKDLTFHHIVKKEHGGDNSLDNGCLLMPQAHQYLHIIEFKSFRHYTLLTKMFIIINRQHTEPTDEQRALIEVILRDFEAQYKDARNSKNKPLVKYEYLKRGYNRT